MFYYQVSILIFAFMLLSSGCKRSVDNIAVNNVKSGQIVNTISGTLTLYLHLHKVNNVYLHYELRQETKMGHTIIITQSGFHPAVQSPLHFSLTYPAEQIVQQGKYLFFVTVAEDAQGKTVIASMSTPVLTQGNPSVLNLAISSPVAPVKKSLSLPR